MTAEEKQEARVHVTFGPSATGSLKIAFETLGRDEQVLGLIDDLSFGPIASADRHTRTQWKADSRPPLAHGPRTRQRWRRIQPARRTGSWLRAT